MLRAVLTIVGVPVVVVWVSPLPALVVPAIVPLPVLGAVLMGKRAQPQFVKQRAVTGKLDQVLIAAVGGLRIASGSLPIGDGQAFVRYSYEFNGPTTQVAAMANLLPPGAASAGRAFNLLDTEEESAPPTAVWRSAGM